MTKGRTWAKYIQDLNLTATEIRKAMILLRTKGLAEAMKYLEGLNTFDVRIDVKDSMVESLWRKEDKKWTRNTN
jgi:hypothetical protein